MNRILKVISIGTFTSIAAVIFLQTFHSHSQAFQTLTAAVCDDDTDPPPELPKATPLEVRRRSEMMLHTAQPQLPRPVSVATLEVIPNPKSSGKKRERQAWLANVLTRQANDAQFVPDGRINHFSWLVAVQHPPILGWRGTILETTQVRSGTSFSVRVQPIFAGNFSTNCYTEETYLLAAGSIHPLNITVSDPDGPRVVTRP